MLTLKPSVSVVVSSVHSIVRAIGTAWESKFKLASVTVLANHISYSGRQTRTKDDNN